MRIATGLAALGIILSAGGAMAQAASPPSRYQLVVAASRDLGISPQQFVACLRPARQAMAAAPAGAARVQARNTLVLPCLQKANPAITADSLGAVIERYRQQRPAAGG